MPTQKDRNKSRIFSDLRSKAELLIKDRSASPQHFSIEEFDKLLHELEVHQIELEKQNGKLNLAHLKAEDSRNRYLDLYDFSPNGYFTVDQNGLIYDVNLAGSDMLGVERRLLKKKRLSSFIVPDCQDAYYLYCNQILETGARQSCVLQLRKNDGTVIWGLLDSIVIPGTDVNSVHLRTTLTDITSQKESEFTLGETEEFYRIILSNISDAVFITDYKGAFIFICPNAAVIFGYNPAEIKIFNNISKLLGNDLFDHHELKQQGEIRNINCRIIDKYGKHHNLLINVKQVHIKGETLLYTCRDATLLINANKELNKHQKHLEEIVETRTDELTGSNKQLRIEIEERKKAENIIRLNESLLEVLLRLSEMREATVKEMADFVLEEGVRLTQSTIGFLGFMNDQETVMTLHSWSKAVMEECRISDKPSISHKEERPLGRGYPTAQTHDYKRLFPSESS